MNALDRAILSSSIYQARSFLGTCKHHADEARALRVGAKLAEAQTLVNQSIEIMEAETTEAQNQQQAVLTGGEK